MGGRIRTIKPELLEDLATAGLSDAAARLLIGLFLLSDDYGRFRAEPELLRSQVWWKSTPTRSIDEALSELGVKLVTFYTVDGQRYGSIRGWGKHQKVDHPAKPRIPAPPSQSSRDSREIPETLAPDLRPWTMDHGPPTEEREPDPDARAHEPAHVAKSEPEPSPESRVRTVEPVPVRMAAMLPPPNDIPITDEMRANCAMAGVREPTLLDVAKCLANGRKHGHERVDWGSELVSWMLKQPRFDREMLVLHKPPLVQVSDEDREAYERGIEAGARGPMAVLWSDQDRASLELGINKFARYDDGEPMRGPRRLEWIEAAASDFMRAVPPNEAKFFSQYRASGWARWLTQDEIKQRRAREAVAVP